jgi:activating signal cointegrator 1
MKCLALWQPWATLIALGFKEYETRSWGTNYRGQIAIHAAKRKMTVDDLKVILRVESTIGHQLDPSLFEIYGAIVCAGNLVECDKMHDLICSDSISTLESIVGLWEPDRYAWKLSDIKRLTYPVPVKGSQGLWNLDSHSVELTNKQTGRK